ncbi:hypothetical protein V3C41_02620 [Paenarthrobacter nicotinovorans]|uniref:Uncharacterized protein n=1 Tax=Paenarthrobacter nicotinovorans TaxID=29320 RepID=A0ABV0GN56_PAENI
MLYPLSYEGLYVHDSKTTLLELEGPDTTTSIQAAGALPEHR